MQRDIDIGKSVIDGDPDQGEGQNIHVEIENVTEVAAAIKDELGVLDEFREELKKIRFGTEVIIGDNIEEVD